MCRPRKRWLKEYWKPQPSGQDVATTKDIIIPIPATFMPFRPLKSFLPTADDVAGDDLSRLGEILLVHLNSYDGKVKQHGVLNREYLRAMLENRNVGLGPLPPAPEYGDRQPEVTRAVMEAFDWLVSEGILSHAPQAGDWFAITRKGEELLRRFGRYEHWEQLGLEQVKADLE